MAPAGGIRDPLGTCSSSVLHAGELDEKGEKNNNNNNKKKKKKKKKKKNPKNFQVWLTLSLCTFFRQNLTTVLLESAEGRERR